MGVQVASLDISGGDLAAGSPPGGWLPWAATLLLPLALALLFHRIGRGDRYQDRAAEAVCDFKALVDEINLEGHRVLGQVVSEVDLKPLRDLQVKAELAPDRLPQPLQLCARELESRLAKYLAVAGPAPTAYSVEEREARMERRLRAGNHLTRAIEAAFKDLDAYRTRRKD
ncbi:hypothetical protein ACFYZ8_34920 [Streptomyces sp. NPDC001668]|uniref:hypothetical protein n=1 Tax=unclassified Streptomyces TaxID=2593676 RepID=UPI00369374EB